jgi:hypothetical protein
MEERQSSMTNMTPEQAVNKLIEIMMAMQNLSRDTIYEALQKAEIPPIFGYLAYHFTQISWGNVAVESFGLEPCDEYYLLDPDGNIVDKGLCSKNAYYLTASELVQEYRLTQAFGYMVQTSSVVLGIDAMLKQGAKLEDLMMMPHVVFLGNPSEAGMNKLNQIMEDYSAKLRELYPPNSDRTVQ